MKINKELAHGSTAMLVLALISKKDMYGYQIIKELKAKSENVFELQEGTLYPILHTLEQNYLVESYYGETDSARKRRYYKITDKGIKELSEKTDEFKVFTTAVGNVLGCTV